MKPGSVSRGFDDFSSSENFKRLLSFYSFFLAARILITRRLIKKFTLLVACFSGSFRKFYKTIFNQIPTRSLNCSR